MWDNKFPLFFFLWLVRLHPTMWLHGQISSSASCLWHVLLPVAYHFLFAVNPLWRCQFTSCSVVPDFLYPIPMFPVLLLVILSCSSASHDWTIVACVSVSSVPQWCSKALRGPDSTVTWGPYPFPLPPFPSPTSLPLSCLSPLFPYPSLRSRPL